MPSLKVSMIEIERKFLVSSKAFKTHAFKHTRIVQGYLNSHKERTVRVRLKGDLGVLTIKGRSTPNGLSRFEWEKDLPKEDAKSLLLLCEKGIIDKVRYEVKVGKHTFEVDEFFGENEGLIIAEVELETEEEGFEKPDWLGDEVTGEIKYYNSQLSKMPYKLWE